MSMTRYRTEYAGAYYHVIQKGNNREHIFNGDGNKGVILEKAGTLKAASDFKLLGYVLMDNHYHFLVQTGKTTQRDNASLYFELIKEGSRKRNLTPYKIAYAKKALEYQYTYREIGHNIRLSDVAVYKLIYKLPVREIFQKDENRLLLSSEYLCALFYFQSRGCGQSPLWIWISLRL